MRYQESFMAEKRYLTIKEAAKYVGVTPLTLRNWDKKGKLSPTRHPMNNYRLYDRRELDIIHRQIEMGRFKDTESKRIYHIKVRYEKDDAGE